MRPIRLDLHTHLCVSKRTAHHAGDVPRFAAAALAAGLDGVLVCEHADTRDVWVVFEELLANHPFRRGRFEAGGAFLFPGLEVTLAEQVDIVLVGRLDELRRIDTAFRVPLSAGHRPSADEFIEASQRFSSSIVRIGAHPLRKGKRLDTLPEPALRSLVDGVEVNAAGGGFRDEQSVHELARRLGCAVTGGSDAHAWPGVGAAWTELFAGGDRIEDVIEAIRLRRCEPKVHPDAGEMVEAGRRLRSRLKGERTAVPSARLAA